MIPVIIIYLVGIVVSVIVFCIISKIRHLRADDDLAITCTMLSTMWPFTIVLLVWIFLWYMFKRSFYGIMSLCDVIVTHFQHDAEK